MASNQGTAIIDFGANPGSNESSVVVTGQTAISSISNIEAYIMASDTTSSHTASDHQWVGNWLKLTAGTIVAATSFTIYGRSLQKLTGTYTIRWVWSD